MLPALLKPITAWPWPVAAIEGIQNCAAAASVAALSYTVPDWCSAGLVVSLIVKSYQREALRAAGLDAHALRAKLVTKNEVIAELMEENVLLKKLDGAL